MDPITIGLMLAGAAITAHGQNQVLKKQSRIAVAGQQEMLNERNKATDVALRKALEFNPDNRAEQQQEIAQAMEGDYRQAVEGTPITAQGVQVGSTIPTAAGTGDYLAATAREKAKSTESLRTLAQLMGRIGSAGQLRRNEAVGIGDTAGAIGRIQNGADNMNQINSHQANMVTPSLGSQLIGGALTSYGAGRMASAGLGAAKVPAGAYSNPDIMQAGFRPVSAWNGG
ncbi:hypothetical protein [Hydrogenophaga sp. 2FB]|uniref:hypothetical protein n=1 Tax=Hydrogenophaga sp. 2FB TaxID=2502187 RepID=UPI0010F63AE7|nr:hypothetical protein [Hydrogenophaga sp. 2FB]